MKTRLLLFLSATLLILTGCHQQVQKITTPSTIMKEAKTLEEHYRLYTDGEYIFLDNLTNNTTKTIRKCNETIKEKLTLPTIEPDSSLPDINFYEHQVEMTPYTYDAPLETSARYLKALEASGWTFYAEYGNYLYLDRYMVNDNAYIRIIIFEHKIKIFHDLTGEVQDPLSYINGYTSSKVE